MSGLELLDVARGTRYPCPLGEVILIGRHSTSSPPTIAIADPRVSRRHCTIHPQESVLEVVDLSSYGTWINQERIQGRGTARKGDMIRLGPRYAFCVLEEGEEPPATTLGRSIPEVFGDRYRIVRELAQGAMGIVFEAVDEETQVPRAIKLLKGSKARPDQVKRFQREAELGRMLAEDPGIVKVVDSGALPGGELYYVMEFVEGKPFNTWITGGMPLKESVRIVAKVARSMDFAHERGVIHRDLKPQNVIVTPDGQARLTDFGVAKALDEVEALTATGQVMGTMTYMAPEQVQDSKRVDRRTDVYGLGALLYAAMTRRTPVDLRGLNMRQSLQKILEHTVAPPCSVDPSLDPLLDAICMRALARRPDDRHPTARALADDLEAWLAGRPSARLPVQTPEDPDEDYVPGKALLIMVGLSLLGLSLLVFLLTR